MAGPAEERIRLDRPAYVYPLFEQALRSAAGVAIDEHRRNLGALWARFSAVAADNPHAWIREPVAAEQIWRPDTGNRMISWPYTKLMNSNNMVDQAAALILTSVQTATRLRIPESSGFSPTPVPTRTTPTRSVNAPSCTAHRRSGSVRPVRCSWPASASMTSTTSTSTRVSRRRCRWPPPRSGWRSMIRPARSPSPGTDVRRRAVEQLRHARHRDDGRASRRPSG